MSSESYDYNPTPQQPSPWAVHLPILLLGLTFSIFIGSIRLDSVAANENMKFQLKNVENQIANVKAAEKQADEMAGKQADPLKVANQLETLYNSLFSDLCDLAKDDEDAKAIVTKWKIQRPQAPAPAEEPKKDAITIGK
jgi:hypothetical protein